MSALHILLDLLPKVLLHDADLAIPLLGILMRLQFL
jgi:hypothetical protein